MCLDMERAKIYLMPNILLSSILCPISNYYYYKIFNVQILFLKCIYMTCCKYITLLFLLNDYTNNVYTVYVIHHS